MSGEMPSQFEPIKNKNELHERLVAHLSEGPGLLSPMAREIRDYSQKLELMMQEYQLAENQSAEHAISEATFDQLRSAIEHAKFEIDELLRDFMELSQKFNIQKDNPTAETELDGNSL